MTQHDIQRAIVATERSATDGSTRPRGSDHRHGQAISAQAVLAALEVVDVLAGTVREAMGYGRQKDRLHQYLGSEYNSSFVPKVELAVFVREEDAPAAIKAIVGQARTGRIGDGKILVLPCYEEYLSW